MARAVTVAQIMASARERIDDAGGELVEDAPLRTYINQAYGKYYDILTSAEPEYFKAEASFNTVAGTRLYALPTGWFGTMYVDRLRSGDDYTPIRRIRPHERLMFSQRGEPVCYQVESAQLAIYPRPDAVYTLRHSYIPVWTALTADGDTIDGLLGNEDLIELEVAVRAMSKEFNGNAPVGLLGERKMALERLQEKAFQRNVIEAQVVGLGEVDNGGWHGQLDGDWTGRRGF